MIQDIKPHVFHNEYRPAEPDEDSCILYYKDDRILLKQNESVVVFPKLRELIAESGENRSLKLQYLFAIDDRRFYLADHVHFDGPTEFQMEKISVFRTAEPRAAAFAGITGYQLYKWYSERRFCGKCGKPLSHSKEERAMVCEDCGIHEYPKISPAVIVAVTSGDRILMSKYARGVYKRYALLAGFAEIGETIEETVEREVYEEVGLKVKNLRYYKSQPWSFSDTLLLGFFAEVEGGEDITLDTDELAEAGWFSRDQIEIDDSTISLTNEMIRKFRDEM